MPDATNSLDATPPPLPTAPPPRPFSYWLHRVMVCNPFYLGSVFLLLLFVYCVSVDPRSYEVESVNFTFNFASFQIYELMLVITAIVLARRLIWDDATLLVILDNLLLVVPFILVSQAAWVDRHMTLGTSLFVAVMAALRWSAVRRWIPGLPLPRRMSVIGLVVLAANAALPVVYRSLHATQTEISRIERTSYHVNEYCWLLLLPLICSLLNFLPSLRGADGKLPGKRRWLPLAIFSFWAAGTGAHLLALNFVYFFDFRREWFAPTLWVLAWSLFLRVNDVVPRPSSQQRMLALLLPLLATLLAAGVEGSHVFLVLTSLNLVVFTAFWLKDWKNRSALHLVLINVSILTAILPWDRFLSQPDVPGPIALAALVYALLCAVLSRDPRAGFGGAIAIAITGGMLLRSYDYPVNWAFQIGLIFLLLHSLRWQDHLTPGAGFLRFAAAVLWVSHSFGWIYCDQAFWTPLVFGLAVLGVCLLVRLVGLLPVRMVVCVAATLSALCTPVNYLLFQGRSASLSLLALGGSFLLFIIGTVAALTKHRWLKPVDIDPSKVNET